jgi:hypothetical protein
MPFLAVFDPSTLLINVDVPFLGSQQLPEIIEKPISDGLNWDGKTFDIRANWEKSADGDLYVQICSAIWHEKRHFLDYVLTNHGQFELRLYSQIYGNLSKILNLCESKRLPLVVPIAVLTETIRRKALKVDGYDFEWIGDLATSIYSRRELLEFGSTPIDSGGPTGQKYSIGGKAQLEALGFYCQAAAIQSVFGADALFSWQERLGMGDWRARYRWPERFLWSYGIDVRSDSIGINLTLIAGLLLASLTTRGWNQDSTARGEMDKYPAGRLLMLCERLRGSETNDLGEIWAVLNRVSKEIFGRSIFEELDQDYEREKEFIENTVKEFDPPAAVAIKDVHRLRGEMINLLKSYPQDFYDPVCWSKRLLPRLHVGCTRLYPAGLRTANDTTWAWRYRETDRFASANGLGLKETEAWRKVEEGAATFAKFFVNGRVDRALIPGALAKTETQLTDRYGIKIQVDPSFAYPPRSGTQGFFRLVRVDKWPCEICNKNIVRNPTGCVIPSFTVRRHPPPGSDPQDARFKDDWRPWLACEECAQSYSHFGRKLG